MRTLYKVSAYLLVLTGIIHIAFSPFFFGHFGLDVLWFAGTGLGMVFLGNLNLIILASEKLAFYTIAISSNMLGILLTGFILTMVSSIQAYISFGIVILAMTGTIAEYIRLLKGVTKKNFTVRY